jgi:hypothetical protein
MAAQQFEVTQSSSITARRAISAKPNANNINIALTAISVAGQQAVSSHMFACSGCVTTAPALSAIARLMSATTVMTVMPLVMAKASARITAILFMIVSPSARQPHSAKTSKELRDGHHVLKLFGRCHER